MNSGIGLVLEGRHARSLHRGSAWLSFDQVVLEGVPSKHKRSDHDGYDAAWCDTHMLNSHKGLLRITTLSV